MFMPDGLSKEEMQRYIEGVEKGQHVYLALLSIKDPRLVKQVIAASIDTWCMKYGYDPLELIESIVDAMYAVHEKDGEEDEE